MTDRETCKTCRYWDRWTKAKLSQGACRAHSPIREMPYEGGGWWPMTNIKDWCGEHKPKDPDQ